jgi:hypothetical protein
MGGYGVFAGFFEAVNFDYAAGYGVDFSYEKVCFLGWFRSTQLSITICNNR